jgi:hypothetical protein
LQLLHEFVPAATVIAQLVRSTDPILAETLLRGLQSAGRAIGQQAARYAVPVIYPYGEFVALP